MPSGASRLNGRMGRPRPLLPPLLASSMWLRLLLLVGHKQGETLRLQALPERQGPSHSGTNAGNGVRPRSRERRGERLLTSGADWRTGQHWDAQPAACHRMPPSLQLTDSKLQRLVALVLF